MKTSAGANNAWYWGTLADKYYDAFTLYFQVTIQKYKEQGIEIYALSFQNEPENEPSNMPVMRLTAQNESNLAILLGPKLRSNNITTKILVWDHNWNDYQFPLDVLSNAQASQYVAGAAFHCYAGDVSAQSKVHDAFPDKEIWFTECSGTTDSSDFGSNIQWNTNNLYMGAIKNWARTVIHWNLALDSNSGPHTGGCGTCRGVVTIASDGGVTYNEEFYGMAMFSKFLNYPAYRLDCGLQGGPGCVSTMCTKTNSGSIVIVVANFCQTPQNIAVQNGNAYVNTNVASGLTTFVW